MTDLEKKEVTISPDDEEQEKSSHSLEKNSGGRRISAFLQADSGRLVLLALLWYLNL